MISTLAQILMHLSEPFVHRHIIQGTYSRESSRGWHLMLLVMWVHIYAFAILLAGLDFKGAAILCLQGLGLRFVAQSIVLNMLMLKDGHRGRTWHDLRDTGTDYWVQIAVWAVISFLRWVKSKFTTEKPESASIETIEKAAIVTGIVVTIIIMLI